MFPQRPTARHRVAAGAALFVCMAMLLPTVAVAQLEPPPAPSTTGTAVAVTSNATDGAMTGGPGITEQTPAGGSGSSSSSSPQDSANSFSSEYLIITCVGGGLFILTLVAGVVMIATSKKDSEQQRGRPGRKDRSHSYASDESGHSQATVPASVQLEPSHSPKSAASGARRKGDDADGGDDSDGGAPKPAWGTPGQGELAASKRRPSNASANDSGTFSIVATNDDASA
jgi:hypothetical protein